MLILIVIIDALLLSGLLFLIAIATTDMPTWLAASGGVLALLVWSLLLIGLWENYWGRQYGKD